MCSMSAPGLVIAMAITSQEHRAAFPLTLELPAELGANEARLGDRSVR